MGPKDNLIICLAEPSWLLADLQGQDEEENFFKITAIARSRGARVVAVIAGDWHQYNRYYANDLDVHFITSGGGGAFLHPTHVLRNSISVHWPERQETFEEAGPQTTNPRQGEALKGKTYDIRLKRNTKPADNVVGQAVQDIQDVILEPLQKGGLSRLRKRTPLPPQAPKCYPDKSRSYLLSLGNVFFPFYNPGFAIAPRRRLLDDHLAVPVAGRPARHLLRQDRPARHRDHGVGRHGLHAALSHPGHDRLDQPDCRAGQSLRDPALVCRRGRVAGAATLSDQVRGRHIALPGASDGHVRPVHDRGDAQQLDGAAHRAAAQCALPFARRTGAHHSRRHRGIADAAAARDAEAREGGDDIDRGAWQGNAGARDRGLYVVSRS